MNNEPSAHDPELPREHRPGTPGDPLDPEEGAFDWARNPLDRVTDDFRGVDHAGVDTPKDREDLVRQDEEKEGDTPAGESVDRPRY